MPTCDRCKQTLFELATRVPLLIRVPGSAASASRGKTARALVELVDMYKTLADLFGLRTETGVEGRSFAPLLRNPETSHSVRVLSSRYYDCSSARSMMVQIEAPGRVTCQRHVCMLKRCSFWCGRSTHSRSTRGALAVRTA